MVLREGVTNPRWMQERVSEDTDPGNPLRPMKAYVTYALTSFHDVLRADPCAYCNGPGGTVDHIQPRFRGGANGWTNLTGACLKCNNSKSDKSLLQVLALRANLPKYRKPLPAHRPIVANPIVGKRTRRSRRYAEFY